MAPLAKTCPRCGSRNIAKIRYQYEGAESLGDYIGYVGTWPLNKKVCTRKKGDFYCQDCRKIFTFPKYESYYTPEEWQQVQDNKAARRQASYQRALYRGAEKREASRQRKEERAQRRREEEIIRKDCESGGNDVLR